MVSAGLEDPEACYELLSFMSRDSVVEELVEGGVASVRVKRELDRQLRDAKSPVVKGIVKALASSLGLTPNPGDIVAYFRPGESRSIDKPDADVPSPSPSGEAVVRPRPRPAEGDTDGDAYEVTLRGRNGAEARGVWDGKQLIVARGSRVNGVPVASFRDIFEKRTRPLLAAAATREGDFYILNQDLPFKTPSGAADFVNAGSTNGWAEWRLPDGRPLSALRESVDSNRNRVGFSG